MGTTNLVLGRQVEFNGWATSELSDDELREVMPAIVRLIGAIPHGEPHIHHFLGYSAPPSGHQFLGYEDGVSATQYLIEPSKFPHKTTAIQASYQSHFLFNYGWKDDKGRTSISVHLFSCSEFDAWDAIHYICKRFHIEEIYFPVGDVPVPISWARPL